MLRIIIHACTVSLLGQLAPPAAVMHCQACGDVRVISSRKCDAVGLLAPLAAGGTAIIPAGGKFSAGTHWRDAVEHKATYYTAVPTMHQVRRWPPLSKQFHCRMHCTLTFVQLCTVSIKVLCEIKVLKLLPISRVTSTPPNQQKPTSVIMGCIHDFWAWMSDVDQQNVLTACFGLRHGCPSMLSVLSLSHWPQREPPGMAASQYWAETWIINNSNWQQLSNLPATHQTASCWPNCQLLSEHPCQDG